MRSLRWAQIISLISAATSTTSLQDLLPPLSLLLLLDVPCPDFEAVPVSPCLCPPRGPLTFTLKSLASQNVLRSAPLTFTLKSVASQDVLTSAPLTFTLKSVTSQDMLASAPLTFTLKSVTSEDMLASASLTFTNKSPQCELLPFGKARHCGTVLFSWRSHLALVILILLQGATSSMHRMPTVGLVSLVVQFLLRYCNMSSGTGLHSTLSYLFVAQVPAPIELVLASRCHILK